MLTASDESLDIVSAGRGSVRLVDGGTASRAYLARVCRSLEADHLRPDVDFDRLRERLSGWPAGTRFDRTGRRSELAVSVPDPARTLLPSWADDEDSAEGRRAGAALQGGLYWEIGLWAVLRLVPGDPDTAARVGLLG